MSVIRDHKPKKEDFQKIFRFIVVYVTLTVIGLSEFLLVKSKEVFADELHQSLSDDITRGGGGVRSSHDYIKSRNITL